MAGAIHFVARSKPPHIGQFWCFHVSKFPTRGIRLPDSVECSQQPLPPPRYRGRNKRLLCLSVVMARRPERSEEEILSEKVLLK